MRRSVQPSFPNAITCCFFSSLKTLLMPTQPTWLRRSQCPGRYLSLAGFELTLIGRFWVTAEAATLVPPGAKRKEADLRKRRAKQTAFLEVFAQIGRIDLAAKKTGIDEHRHYEWLEKDPEYRKQFEIRKEHAPPYRRSFPAKLRLRRKRQKQ